MKVFVLTCTDLGAGYIAAVFSSNEKACHYIEAHPYSSFTMSEYIIDRLAVKDDTSVNDAKA